MDDDDLREDFHRIQAKLSEVIHEDVNTRLSRRALEEAV
jgi:hypothetical protein